ALSAGNEWLKPGAWGSVTKGKTDQKRRGHLRKLRRALVLWLWMPERRGRDVGLAESGFRPAMFPSLQDWLFCSLS
ncbi:MAG: hypothetical protein WB696_24195, partial [Chthoniobacterales bacterium]